MKNSNIMMELKELISNIRAKMIEMSPDVGDKSNAWCDNLWFEMRVGKYYK